MHAHTVIIGSQNGMVPLKRQGIIKVLANSHWTWGVGAVTYRHKYRHKKSIIRLLVRDVSMKWGVWR